VPLVFFDRTIKRIGFSSVGIDDRTAASELVAYAIGCGYKSIAHLAGSLTIGIGRERHAGYLETVKKQYSN
jgi:LacI family transcriptional regulator, repressor for deo operon, udp, cdd, tsx, nupC, and nupG